MKDEDIVEGARPIGFGFIRFPWEKGRWRDARAKSRSAGDADDESAAAPAITLVPAVPHEGPLLKQGREALGRIIGVAGQMPEDGERFGEPEDRQAVLQALRAEFHHLSRLEVTAILAVTNLPVPGRCDEAARLQREVSAPGHVSAEMLRWAVVVVPEIVREALSVRHGDG